MKKIEFWCVPSGEVRYKMDSEEEKRLTKFSNEVIEWVLKLVWLRFPKTYSRLYDKYKHVPDKTEARFRMAENFIRCNFSAHDTLSWDISHNKINLEEVKCPLRGRDWLCQDEGCICKPYQKIMLTDMQKEILVRYRDGMNINEIAADMGKNKNTVNNILTLIMKKLGFKTTNALIAFAASYEGIF